MPETPAIESLEIIGGRDKDGVPEDFRWRFVPGEVVCLVGPTGAGKSRLLADVECLAQGDTPSGRKVLLDGKEPDARTRFSIDRKLVAQIAQNMNFVMDLGAREFLRLHARSRELDRAEEAVERVLESASSLSGEGFGPDTPLARLSGGQSRALMIADAAFLSPKPIVLVDEIENAGVDRVKALRLFTEGGKLLFISTHDPLLALSGTRRVVVRNGGASEVAREGEAIDAVVAELKRIDAYIGGLRERLRRGETLA
jgi:ABC-type lipoprotein export system ATPase subunit